MPKTVRGPFEVQIAPVTDGPGKHVAQVTLATLTKSYEGPLQGASKGHMLSHMTSTDGSAGYVALEFFVGTLDGRSGSFALQHSGTMNRGAPALRVSIVPDSGTDELAGISGTLDIEVGDGHAYVLDYTLD